MAHSVIPSQMSKTLLVGLMAIAVANPAQAIVYGFGQTGGPGSTHGGQIFVEVLENLATSANDVLFTFTNQLPVINVNLPPSLSFVYFDTGTHTDLFSALSVFAGTPVGTAPFNGVRMVTRSATSHPFFPVNFTPEHKFGLDTAYPYDRPIYGVNPGEYVTISATLGTGKSFTDVIDAMNQGINPLQATSGLRLGAFMYFMNGAGYDDGGFVTNSVAAVPEPSSWAMMLAGLGLVGLALRRRSV